VQRRVKRAVDIVGAAAALILLSPVLLVAAAAVRVTMGRPVLFRQTRPGLNAAPFEIVKFRTMKIAGEREKWFRTDHQRLTGLGRILRRTSIDELPELWNVLRGEMSLVGPRPLLMEYLQKYTATEARRHDMPPGMTGWAQVNGRQAVKFSERLAHDVWYVDNWSLPVDLKILAMTAYAVLGGFGVRPGQDVDEVDDLGLSADRERVEVDRS
jgi:lipopolysaccharide/colanic/teichoic acid biosynthesis glycosyltransferase